MDRVQIVEILGEPLEKLIISEVDMYINDDIHATVELNFTVHNYSDRKHCVYNVIMFYAKSCAFLSDNYDTLDEAEDAFKERINFMRRVVKPTKEKELFTDAA